MSLDKGFITTQSVSEGQTVLRLRSGLGLSQQALTLRIGSATSASGFKLVMPSPTEEPNKESKDRRADSQDSDDLHRLSNEQLLNQLACSPCANRTLPANATLEDYLRSVEAKE